jgi:hypothetical protein
MQGLFEAVMFLTSGLTVLYVNTVEAAVAAAAAAGAELVAVREVV